MKRAWAIIDNQAAAADCRKGYVGFCLIKILSILQVFTIFFGEYMGENWQTGCGQIF
jgi:hypothetical protein